MGLFRPVAGQLYFAFTGWTLRKQFSLRQTLQTGPLEHPASYSMATGDKEAAARSLPLPFSAETKNAWETDPYACVLESVRYISRFDVS